jgi:sulfonate transport system permease protein
MNDSSTGRARKAWRGLILPLTLLVLWQFIAARGLVSPLVLPAPAQVLHALGTLATSGLLTQSLAVSLQRLLYGYTIGVALGVALGVLLATSPLARKLIAPSFYAIARIPLLAWIPFLMVVFGLGEPLKIFIIAKAALTPVTINTERAISAISPGWRELGRLYGLPFLPTACKILLPATLLPIFVGLRFGLVQAWSALVAVELLAASAGLGYQLTMSRQLFQLDTMMALMLVIGVIGLALDWLLAASERRLVRRYGGAA